MVASQQGRHDYNASSLNYLFRADGEGTWVRQDVATYQEYGVTYWLTALYPASQPGLVEACNINDYGVTLDEVQAACGLLTIADIQALPANLTTALAISHNIPENVQAIKVSGQTSIRLMHEHGRWYDRFWHFCQRCGWAWASNVKKPQQCAQRSDCYSEAWWHA